MLSRNDGVVGGYERMEQGNDVLTRSGSGFIWFSSENKELKDELNELKIFIKKKLGDE